MANDWVRFMSEQREMPYFHALEHFVAEERKQFEVYPTESDVYSALTLTPLTQTRVVIVGQDPYHGPGQAHGLCFSVQRETAIPPSLRNIFKELHNDLGFNIPTHGDLSHWARQGVLLLNTTLTVRAGEAGSHVGRGWETFTDAAISLVNEKDERCVFILWGANARKKKALITNDVHVILESPHPSPLSAHAGFFGTQPFSRANSALRDAGRGEIDWEIAD